MIGEGQRGATLESLLTKVRMLNRTLTLHRNVSVVRVTSLVSIVLAQPQLIGMSATLANIDDLLQFLDAQFYEERFRPVVGRTRTKKKCSPCKYSSRLG
jgi:replicative superfamily II helicase